MSLLLDQQLVEEVADTCPDQFLSYYKCLSDGDAQKCLKQQQTLSNCVKSKAPSFKKIISNCSEQMSTYENCIRANPDFRTKCFSELADMRLCVKQVVPKKESRQE